MVYSMIIVQRTAGKFGICNPRPNHHREGDGWTEMICDTAAGKWTVWKTASGPPRRGARPGPHFSQCQDRFSHRENISIPGDDGGGKAERCIQESLLNNDRINRADFDG